MVGAVGHHGFIMRQRTRHIYVPVAVDVATGELVRSPKTGFVQRQPYEVGGEILVRIDSEKAFPGYFQDPVATAKKFARDVFATGDLWYRTGDLLRRTHDGRWFFLDRLGDTYRWKSKNVSTAEVGEILGHYPGVSEAIVYGVSVPNPRQSWLRGPRHRTGISE
jgi:acyl-CoA synthetase (AMP-forming)/AMP-acid ligase II